MEMRTAIFVDVHKMNAGCCVGRGCKRSASKTAGALLWCDFVELGYEVIGHKRKVCREVAAVESDCRWASFGSRHWDRADSRMCPIRAGDGSSPRILLLPTSC